MSPVMDAFFSSFEGDSSVLQFIGKHGYKIYDEFELYQMYIHLLVSALFPIYIGSHASLHRPPSAKAPSKSLRSLKDSEDDDNDDDLEAEATVEGLSPSDAIVFPVLAGLTLGGLYFVIKVLKNAALLNKILGLYFSCLGVFGVGKLAADSLNVATTFVFPDVWATRTDTYHVDPLLSQQVTGEVRKTRTQLHRKFVDKNNPFPGWLSNIDFSDRVNKMLWSFRALLRSHWVFRGYLHGVFSAKTKVRINDVVGFIFGLAVVIVYNLNNKPWWLTNLIGFGFCYGTLQLMSPTTFWTGSLVLTGLFIYDITMVFYTPLMVTVATSLDVPIKLVFPGPKRGSMLGLGDVVLPGIMMALALRFDLYLHYLRLQRRNSTSPTTSADELTTTIESSVKIEYVDATSHWGERFWTRKAKPNTEPTIADGGRFPKPYFTASVVGYLIGMLATLVVLNVWNHAQPALLYLVPGVLIALWGTAVVRGERRLMWEYTEDGSLDEEFDDGKEKEKDKGKTDVGVKSDTKGESETEKKDQKGGEHAHHVFLFSLSEPRDRSGLKKPKMFEKS